MRWYKNRRLVNYDGKALMEAGHGQGRYPISRLQRQAILTLSYAVSGRLLLTESFKKFSPEVIYDLSRVYPFHSSPLSARPLDAFMNENPSVFDFIISPAWHQVVIYNNTEVSREISVDLSGSQASGAMGLNAGDSYYLYDFWNDRYLGKYDGNDSVRQELSAGEARMITVHAVEAHPQWISPDRHIMQGYVDMVKKPVWDPSARTLSGVSSLIEGEPCRITLALNNHRPLKVVVKGAEAEIKVRKENPNLADLVLLVTENQDLAWEVLFE